MVLDKYKKRYAAVLKSNPKFIKKYPNPDAVIYGMVMNEVKKESKILNENEKKALDIKAPYVILLSKKIANTVNNINLSCTKTLLMTSDKLVFKKIPY